MSIPNHELFGYDMATGREDPLAPTYREACKALVAIANVDAVLDDLDWTPRERSDLLTYIRMHVRTIVKDCERMMSDGKSR